MKRHISVYLLFALLFSLVGCKKEAERTTIWGETLDVGVAAVDDIQFSDIQLNGEMIVLTISGPDTYFDYHGRDAGTQFLACEKFAKHVGVSLRVELCKDTAEVLNRLRNREGDVAVLQLVKSSVLCQDFKDDILFCGMAKSDSSQWAVSTGNKSLADTLNGWYDAKILAEVESEMKRMNTSPYVTRHVYSPMQDSEHGIISSYDAYFKQYAPIAGFDWRLLAAQCYQESAFDVRAVSWAGAQGLMQIMPSTASHLGMSSGDVWNAERNIEAATRYIKELSAQFRDIESSAERKKFVLASYNGGYNHIRDAMALTRKYGGNAKSWSDVRKYVLLLSDSKYYTDEVVKYGYMRGSETAGYVDSIISRWNSYKSKVAGGPVGSTDSSIPRPAKKPHRFKL